MKRIMRISEQTCVWVYDSLVQQIPEDNRAHSADHDNWTVSSMVLLIHTYNSWNTICTTTLYGILKESRVLYECSSSSRSSNGSSWMAFCLKLKCKRRHICDGWLLNLPPRLAYGTIWNFAIFILCLFCVLLLSAIIYDMNGLVLLCVAYVCLCLPWTAFTVVIIILPMIKATATLNIILNI